jgi:hypothetical protein
MSKIAHGTVGGLIGGIAFGIMMGKMGMLPMIGKMIGQPTVLAGWVVHLFISASIGGSFGLFLGGYARDLARSLKAGLAYGALWWLLGPLTLMPLFLGMGLGVNWNLAAATNALPSFVGHLLFGGLLGAYFGFFRQRVIERDPIGRPQTVPVEET